MSSFSLLSKKMQKKVWDMKWNSFTPIQDKTIPLIINTTKDIVLCSGTASGKTEAVFLPILSLIEESARTSLKVMYISPLKALINNQFERIDKLCDSLELSIHKWHGDVDQSKKKKLIKNPSGILQITPESIESILINRNESASVLFKDLEFIIIDEIHSFLNSERGVQLRSLLYRINYYVKNTPRIIGLSATIDNFDFVKWWLNLDNRENIEIVEERDSDKELYYSLMHFNCDKDGKIPIELYEDIRELTKDSKSIIFCNSRGTVEETTVLLNRLSERDGTGENYYAHHSSIDKKEREYVEKTMAESNLPKSIVATSSLELGIDIGDVEFIIQMDSTFTVSSLKQRLGRSGRKKESSQMLQLYTTKKDSLLQSIAVMELLLERWIEPAHGYPLPYDILFHQIISLCNETNGLAFKDLIARINSISIFNSINKDNIELLIKYMVEKDYLEIILGRNEYIVGIEGERLLRNKEFYSVFMTSEEYTVQYGNKKIGQLDKNMPINEGNNIILAGKIWTIIYVDMKTDKVYVEKASNAKPPMYISGEGKLHSKILEKMWEILCNDKEFNYINDTAWELLKDLRRPYKICNANCNERIIWKNKDEMIFETFTGTKIFRTLVWMLKVLEVKVDQYDSFGRIKIKGKYNLEEILNTIENKKWDSNELCGVIKENEWFKSKYLEYIPRSLQVDMHVAHEIDIEGVLEFLRKYKIRIVEEDV